MRDTPNRVGWLIGISVVSMLSLIGQLYHITVPQASAWEAKAEENMLRSLPSYGPRGAIYDRNGRALATSEPAFAAVLVDQEPSHVEKMLPSLALLLANNDPERASEIVADVLKRAKLNQGRQFDPLPIRRNLSQEQVTALIERRLEFPGVALVPETVRHYPNQSLAGALLGYVGPMTEEVKDPAFKDYSPNELVGKDGLEKTYESFLRGQPGHSSLIVDPYGNPIEGVEQTPPVPGNNLYLTLDLNLQRVAEDALRNQIEWLKERHDPKIKPVRGAVVAQDVKTGAILAMVSLPTYDPNLLIQEKTEAQWQALQNQPGGIFVNWAIMGFAPGSTYKMATGLAGLEGGVLGPYEQIPCPAAFWKYGNPKNWTGYDQGPATISRALAISCNPFFWEVADRLGIDKLAKSNAQFGFGQKSGIDLPDEAAGKNPTEESYGDRWQPGNTINVAIGQGDVLVTPLQLANYTATIAASGTRYKPYLVQEIRDASGKVTSRREPIVAGKVQASETTWKRIQDGMRETVVSPEGTAHWAFLGFPSNIHVAAKTGSAETGTGYDHALTVAYAPFEDPQIAVSVIVQGGSVGSWTGPVARRVMAAYFGVQDIIPRDVPTYQDPPAVKP